MRSPPTAAEWHEVINELKEQANKAEIARRYGLARKMRNLIGRLDDMAASATAEEP